MSQRPVAYDGVVRWLHSYAARHGQADPRHGKTWLPAGEVASYYALYEKDMLQRHGVTKPSGQPKRCRIAGKRCVGVPPSVSQADAEASAGAYAPAADFDTFKNVWQIECPWLVIRDNASSADAASHN